MALQDHDLKCIEGRHIKDILRNINVYVRYGFFKTLLYHTGFVYIRYISLDVFPMYMHLHCLRSFFFFFFFFVFF